MPATENPAVAIVSARSKSRLWRLVAGVRWILLLTLGLVLTSPAKAVDPLPPEIEKASEEVQAAYREKVGREALSQQVLVGRQRHERRMRYKQTLGANMRTEAALRRAELRARAQEQSVRLFSEDAQGASNMEICAAVALPLLVGCLAHRLVSRKRGGERYA